VFYGAAEGFTLHGYMGSTAESYARTNGIKFAYLGLAPTGQCGNDVAWHFDAETGIVNFVGSGPIWDYDPATNPSPFDGNDQILQAQIDIDITAISDWFFHDCVNLIRVTIPAVTKIGV